MAPTLAVNYKTDLFERLNAFSTRNNAIYSRSNLDQFHSVFRRSFPTLPQDFLVKCNCLADILQGLIPSRALTDAPWQTRNFGNDVSVFAGVKEDSSIHSVTSSEF
jgi:hypothetical protein